MAEVKAFKALRFTERAGDISKNVCPPYDIISEEERLDYIKTSENNIIRLEKPVGDNAYENAKKLYLEMSDKGIIDCDEKKGIYVYEEEFDALGNRYKIKGIFVRVRLEEFDKKVVLPHEETLSKAKQDRFDLMCSTFCNFSPIYCMYTDEKREISSLVDVMSAGDAEVEFTARDGVIQRIWKCEDESVTDKVEELFKDKQLFIADGHHRYETGLRFRNHLIDKGVIKDRDHDANFIMMFLIDMENSGLVVFPTHRMVTGLENFDLDKALDGMKQYFDVTEIAEADVDKALSENADNKANVLAAPDGKFYLSVMKADAEKKLSEMNPDKSDSYKGLDVTVLHSLILENVLGIDKENMAQQINLKYTRDKDEAIESVKSGKANCSFIINATKVEEIKAVALANEKMPQKSTYFYPKLITGLVMNRLSDKEILR
ncbi:MAG: DUF1015 domain-containing protein [Ruminococcaceae bacterium]|nr:DUF1015 domain-containing protein [Oscillospiraceae bacterium]